jgi:hypothetical protein
VGPEMTKIKNEGFREFFANYLEARVIIC